MSSERWDGDEKRPRISVGEFAAEKFLELSVDGSE